MRILVIEDEPRMASLLEQGLREEGYQVVAASDGRRGFEFALAGSIDLILLDLMLPLMDGFQVARRLRESGSRIPILMLTARDAEADIVHGLDLGADDYLVKPFSFDVLLARIRALSRRGPVATPVALRVADLTMDSATREVTRGARSINLTPREYGLLELLLRSSPRVLERDKILEALWGHDGDVTTNTLEAFIHTLRGKIEHPGEARLIRTVRGVGYSLRTEPSE